MTVVTLDAFFVAHPWRSYHEVVKPSPARSADTVGIMSRNSWLLCAAHIYRRIV